MIQIKYKLNELKRWIWIKYKFQRWLLKIILIIKIKNLYYLV